MSQYQDLARCLLAVGGATDPEGKGTYLLYNDRSNLISKQWLGESFGDKELITSSLRPNSPAAYIFTPNNRVIICVSSASTLAVWRFKEEYDQWVEDDTIPRFEVHADSKLAASSDADEHICVFCQDPSGRLVYLDDSWSPTILPADIAVGSPISSFRQIAEGNTLLLHVFYVSPKDNCLHYVTQESDGSWHEKLMAPCPLWDNEKPRRIIMGVNLENQAFEAHMLTEGNTVLQLKGKGEGEKVELGKIDKEGEFEPNTTAQCVYFLCLPMVRYVPVYVPVYQCYPTWCCF
jgi:hypothetical protein